MAKLDDEQCLALADAADRRKARGEALGALHGLPISIKDTESAVGFPFMRGSPIFRNDLPKEDSVLDGRPRRAGVLTIGNGLSLPAAKAAAARATCLAAMLLGNAQETLAEIRADAATAADRSGDPLTGKHERLRALRKTAPEALVPSGSVPRRTTLPPSLRS